MTRLEGLDLRKSGDILKIGFVCPRVGLIAPNFFETNEIHQWKKKNIQIKKDTKFC